MSASSAEILVRAEGVSKKFCRSLKRSLWYGLQDLGNELRGRTHGGDGELRKDEFWAVRDISFELKRGECLGLIGHNGAGKTTLLRMFNGLIKPDRGRIEMYGKVGGLIALGAGFNPVLTGRENIYVYASTLGISKREVDTKLDEIIDFAEIEEFIDMPVRSYSSGMTVRLGFSVAAILIKPDVLLLDEILAVGDIGFTIKCLNAVRTISQNSAVIFVSHNLKYVSIFCNRLLVMKQGSIVVETTDLSTGFEHYYSLVRNIKQVSGTGEAKILDAVIVDKNDQISDEKTIPYGSILKLKIKIYSEESRSTVNLKLTILDESMNALIDMPVYDCHGNLSPLPTGLIEIEVNCGHLDLAAGKYSLITVVSDPKTGKILNRTQGLCSFRISDGKRGWSGIFRPVYPTLVTNQATTSENS